MATAVLILFQTVGLASDKAFAEERWRSVRVADAKKQHSKKNMLSRSEAIARARAHVGNSEPISAELQTLDNGDAFYRIKLLSDGNVVVVRVDAYTGFIQP